MATFALRLPSHVPDFRIGNLNYQTGIADTLTVQPQISGLTTITCSICFGLMERPVYLPKCCHAICEPCLIQQWQVVQFGLPNQPMACPECRQAVPSIYTCRTFVRMSEQEKRVFRIVDVKCPNNCGQKFSLKELLLHRNRFCPNRLVLCPHFSCTFVCAFKDLDAHFQKCEELCEIAVCCKLPVANKDKENHDCAHLRLRLAANQQERHIIDLFTGRFVFKYPPHAVYSSLAEYISSIERSSENNARRRVLPRRPVPTILSGASGILLDNNFSVYEYSL
jgi:hypothetical protein